MKHEPPWFVVVYNHNFHFRRCKRAKCADEVATEQTVVLYHKMKSFAVPFLGFFPAREEMLCNMMPRTLGLIFFESGLAALHHCSVRLSIR